MKKLKDLAEVTAKRSDAALVIYKGIVTMYAGDGPERMQLSADCRDDEKIHRIIMELNYGRFKDPRKMKGAA